MVKNELEPTDQIAPKENTPAAYIELQINDAETGQVAKRPLVIGKTYTFLFWIRTKPIPGDPRQLPALAQHSLLARKQIDAVMYTKGAQVDSFKASVVIPSEEELIQTEKVGAYIPFQITPRSKHFFVSCDFHFNYMLLANVRSLFEAVPG